MGVLEAASTIRTISKKYRDLYIKDPSQVFLSPFVDIYRTFLLLEATLSITEYRFQVSKALHNLQDALGGKDVYKILWESSASDEDKLKDTLEWKKALLVLKSPNL